MRRASGARDPYVVLGVAYGASAAELKSAFRKLALSHHPDRCADGASDERFREIAAAYDLLSNPRNVSCDDGEPRRRQPGRDVKLVLSLDFTEAALGVAKTVRYRTFAPCPACAGTGCRRCGEAGRVRREREIALRIQPAAVDGAVTRVVGEGERGERGGAPGDLLVVLAIASHPLLVRDGHHVGLELPVTPAEAALGVNVEVPTLDGPVVMRVPPGTQSGHLFRMRGRGIPRDGAGKGRGDQHVRVVVETPTRLTKRQRALMAELVVEGLTGYPRRRAFARKAKSRSRID